MTTSVSNISTIIGIKYNLISPTAIINTITYPNVKISQLASTINNLFTSYGSGQTNYVTIPIKMSDLYLTLNNLIPNIKTNPVTYSTPGTFTVNVPQNAFTAYITITGAGAGAGGGGSATLGPTGNTIAGGGGGGGGDIPGSYSFSISVSSGTGFTLTIPSGGTGGIGTAEVAGTNGSVASGNTILSYTGQTYEVYFNTQYGGYGGGIRSGDNAGSGGIGAPIGPGCSNSIISANNYTVVTAPVAGFQGNDGSIGSAAGVLGGLGSGGGNVGNILSPGAPGAGAIGGNGGRNPTIGGTNGAAGANGSIQIYYI